MVKIHADEQVITQINVFEVDPGSQDALAELLKEAIQKVSGMPVEFQQVSIRVWMGSGSRTTRRLPIMPRGRGLWLGSRVTVFSTASGNYRNQIRASVHLQPDLGVKLIRRLRVRPDALASP
jgi:hypothetical protein